MSERIVIVNADDFGQSRGINNGIIKAFEEGIVTSTSLMVRYSAAKEASQYAISHPGLGLGLHLDLGEWFLKDEEWRQVYEVVDIDDILAIEKEIERQVEQFRSLLGREPDHINSHQHVHLREHILPVVSAVAERLDVPLRRCTNNIRYCGDFYGQLEDGSTYHQAISAESLCNILASLPIGITEVACHPGLDVEVNTMYKKEREIEVDSLCDKSIKEIIRSNNIKVTNFGAYHF